MPSDRAIRIWSIQDPTCQVRAGRVIWVVSSVISNQETNCNNSVQDSFLRKLFLPRSMYPVQRQQWKLRTLKSSFQCSVRRSEFYRFEMSNSEVPSAPVAPQVPLRTVIVVHPRENRKKCSVEPLRPRPDFEFHKFRARNPVLLAPDRYVRLGIGGPLLSPADAGYGLLVLDGTWRWAEEMEADYVDIPIRSLPPWQTAYPRISKVFEDPVTGLATIEAIWLAYWCLGRDTTGLLDSYRWGKQFLECNQHRTDVQNESTSCL